MEEGYTYQYSNLVNYKDNTVDSINYSPFQSSASPESFPEIMENGILVKYEYLQNASEEIQEPVFSEEERIKE